MRYHRVRIHGVDDHQYRAYIAKILASKANHKASRPASNRSLFGGEAEQIVRQWLAQFHPLSERRYVEYDERIGKQLLRKYRELDAVYEYDAQHYHVFEVKATSQVRSIGRGLHQLSETHAILHTIVPHVARTLVLIDTGIISDEEVVALMQSDDAPFHAPATIRSFFVENNHMPLYDSVAFQPDRTIDVSVVRFPLADICALAEAHGIELHLDWSDEDEESDIVETPPATTYSSQAQSDDSDDDNPFAAALRRAIDHS